MMGRPVYVNMYFSAVAIAGIVMGCLFGVLIIILIILGSLGILKGKFIYYSFNEKDEFIVYNDLMSR